MGYPRQAPHKIVAVNYYECRQSIAASTTINETFFDGAGTASGEYNDLGADAILPNDRSGDITGIWIINSSTVTTTPAAAYDNIAAGMVSILTRCELRLRVAGVEIWRVPVKAACGPPEWYFGVASAAGAVQWTQNGGYQMNPIAHPVGSRNKIQVSLVSKTAVDIAPVAATWFMTVALQVADKQAIAAQGV